MIEKVSGLWEALLFAAMGAALGIGALMASNQPISARLLVGRAISTAGVSVAAGAVLLWFPDLPQLGRIGVAAALGVLGAAGLERILMRVIGQAKSTVEGNPNE